MASSRCGRYQDAEEEKRRVLLNTEMKKAGFECYESLMRRPKSSMADKFDDVGDTVSNFMTYGDPSLKETLKKLVPFTRKCMLIELDCWIDGDARCREFITGIEGKWKEIDIVKDTIMRERAERLQILESSVSERGGSVLPIETGRSRCVAEERVVERFVKKGVGNVDFIGYGIAIASHHNDLKCAYRTSNLQMPAIRINDLFLSLLGLSGTLDFENIISKITPLYCDSRIIDYLLSGSSQGARELVVLLEAERSCRDQRVHSLMTTWELDEMNRMRYFTLNRELESFSVENIGDVESIFFRFVLNEELRKHDLPTESRYISETALMKERFETCRLDGDGKESINALVRQLQDEERTRRATLLEVFTEAVARDSRINLLGEPASDLRKILLDLRIAKGFIGFGTISILDAVRSMLKAFRKYALDEALENANPPMLYTRLGSRTLHDLRYGEFIDGLRPENTEELISTWQVEERHRQDEIRSALQTEGVSLDQLDCSNFTNAYHEYMQGADCLSSTAVASEIAQKIRRSELRHELENTDLSFWIAQKLPILNEFIHGRSTCLSAADAVATVIHDGHNRKKELAKMVRESNLEQEHCNYDVVTATKKYINEGEGTAGWIASAYFYFSRRKVCVEAFGKLSSILPNIKFGEVTEHRNAMENFVINEAPPARLGLNLESRQLIMSYVGSFDDVVNFSFRSDSGSGSVSEGESLGSSSSSGGYHIEDSLRARLILLLTNHPDCPWENAVEAVAALRLERTERIRRFDELFPGYKKEVMSMTSFGNETKQDKEDGIINNYDRRAYFINGKISEAVAIKDLTKMKRKAILEVALSDAILFNKLIKKDKRCQTYINTLEFENASESLSMLIASLQKEKSVRLLLLEGAFRVAGIVDTGVGITSVTIHGIGDHLDFDPCDDYIYDSYSFPSEIEVALARNSYIHLGEKSPKEVIRTVVMFLRTEQLERLLDEHFNSWLKSDVEAWMHNSKACKYFVANIDAGLLTQDEMDIFATTLSDADSERGNIPQSDYDCGGNDWKYHLSGGDYGNDPDNDATWNAYWDC